MRMFVCLSVRLHNSKTARPNFIKKRIAITCNCMASLDLDIWHSSISLPTNPRLYRVFILPVILYGAETCSPLDSWQRIWMHSTNGVRVVYFEFLGGRSFLTKSFTDALTSYHSHTITRTTRLKFLGHTARTVHGPQSSPSTSVAPLPRDWNCRSGRPRHTWLPTIESDLAPLNIGLATAYHRAQN